MSITTRLFDFMQMKNLKQIDLAEHLNVNKSVVTSWKNRGNAPPAEYLVKICEFLDITIFELLGIDPIDTATNELSDDEKQMLKKYRRLSDYNRGKLDERINVMLEAQENSNLSTSKTG